MESQPLVSVIMPVYNGDKYLSEAIESVLNQTFSDLELIIIDDGSKDTSAEIAEKYQQLDKRVVLIRQENSGVSATRNRALQLVRGQWVYFIDCDDIYFPNYIERMMEISGLTGADYVCCNFDMGYQLNLMAYKPCAEDEIVVFDQDSIEAFDYLCSQGAGTGLWLKQISTQIIQNNNIGFDTTMTYGEDLFFCWKACLASNKVAYVPEKLYFYRQTATSTVSKVHPQLFEKYENAHVDMEYFAIENGFMNDAFKQSVAVSFVQRLPALVRMTAREKRGVLGTYKRIKEIINSERMQDALTKYDTEIENIMTGGAKRLYLQAKQKKVFSMMAQAYYSNFRMQIVRKIKGGK